MAIYNAAQMKWPSQADVRAFYGSPGNPQCTAGIANLPFEMRIAWDKDEKINRFRCHVRVEAPIERIFQNVLKHYGEAKIKELGLDLFGGCYNLRPMRGTERNPVWSMHAFGIAVDLDPERNQLKWSHAKAAFARDVYVPFWNIVEAEGGVSLGREFDYDWMHFQFARK